MPGLDDLYTQIPTSDIARKLGADETEVDAAVRTLVPVLLTGLHRHSQDPEHAGRIESAASSHAARGLLTRAGRSTRLTGAAKKRPKRPSPRYSPAMTATAWHRHWPVVGPEGENFCSGCCRWCSRSCWHTWEISSGRAAHCRVPRSSTRNTRKQAPVAAWLSCSAGSSGAEMMKRPSATCWVAEAARWGTSSAGCSAAKSNPAQSVGRTG